MGSKRGGWAAGAAALGIVTCIAGFGVSPARVSGQGAAGKRGAPSDALWDQMERGQHTGSLQDALVGVEVTATTSDAAVKKIRRGNGLVLRCDGFILVPTALFGTSLSVAGSTEEAAELQIVIVTRPGMAGERRVSAHRPRFERPGLGYTVVKVNNWHGPSMTTESAEGLRQGDTLAVYSTEWDAEAKRWAQVKLRAAKAGPLPAADADKQRPGRRLFAEPLEKVVPGALVCGGSGRAVGVVVSSSAEKGTEEFVGFDVLGLATNCVVPEAPHEQEQEQEAGGEPKSKTQNPKSDTVKVPGGPVMLPGPVLQLQADMEGAKYACVAPFEIDKYEVTNRQYLEFWENLPAARKKELGFQSQYYPAGWSKRGAPFPPEVAEFPVVGVPLPGAYAFARSLGKRLPTPYEWCLAALGSQGATVQPDWMAGYLRDRRSAWEKACNLHYEYRETTLANNQSSRNPEMYQLPWIAGTLDLMEASVWSKRITEQLTEPVRRQYGDPDYLAAVGTRDVDESPFGARDMLLNAAELVVTHPSAPTRGNERYMVSEFLPAKLPQNAPFVPRLTEILGARDGYPEYPHLSRLFRRMINGPSTADLVAWSNVAEMERILAPVGGWELRMSILQQTGYIGKPPGGGLNALSRAPGLKLWEEMPRHFRPEIGLPVPLDEIDRRIPMGPSLFYMPVGGFRCVKAQ